MARVKRTKEADEDIVDIWTYIADDNSTAADRLLKTFESTFAMLARRPLLGRSRDELLPGLRSFPVGNYVVFYHRIKGGVSIIHVMSAARDVTRMFPG
ncbi:MAG: type II toxin-antitoxin system RelE/ParE family toxin [Terriglobales bacterium]